MKSLLFQTDATPFSEPTRCSAIPCRNEVPISIRKDGRLYTFVLRDKIIPEDSYLVMVKATAFAIQNSEPYSGSAPTRSIKDFLIKSNVVI